MKRISLNSAAAAALFFSMLYSCEKKEHEVHQMPATMQAEQNIQGVTVVNEEDPVCKMKVAGAVADTATYQGKLYGFCSTTCKQEFKKAPQDYVK